MPSYNRKDRFYHKAKQEGYPSRAAYKLLELDQKFKIFKPGRRMVDLGAAPGGWLMVIDQKLNTPGVKAVGIDLLPLHFSPSSSTQFIQGNFLDANNAKKVRELLGNQPDWVVSDMAPNTSGIAFVDSLGSIELCQAALQFAKENLKPGGGLIVKVFPGKELEQFRKDVKAVFEKLSTFIPESTRKTSEEIYLVGHKLKSQKF